MTYPQQQTYVDAVSSQQQGRCSDVVADHKVAAQRCCLFFLAGCGQEVSFRSLLVLLSVFCLLGTARKPVVAKEPALEFLNGLRSRGYHDTALDYLKSLETSALLPADMRDLLGYETALTLVIASRSSGELEERYKMLGEAQTLLREFIVDNSQHPKLYAARSQLGNLIVERARIKVGESRSGNAQELKAEARELYDQAFKECGVLEAAVSKELDLIPKVLDMRDREEAKLAARRKQLRADNLQTELLAAAIREEAADTVPAGSEAWTTYLVEAAGLYDAIYKKYRSRLAGLYARMYQGRCNYRLGRTKDALGHYGELLDQPSSPEAFWNLKTKTLRLAMDSWLDPQERKYVEAIKQASGWVEAAPRSAQRSSDMLAIRLSLAFALQMQAKDYEKRNSPDVATIRNSYEDALKNARFVAAEEGNLQEEAAELVVSLGGRTLRDPDALPETFAEAQKEGKKFLDEIAPAAQEVANLEALSVRSNSAASDDVRQQVEIAKANLAFVQKSALNAYRLAMRLADVDTPPSELNLVRYFICYLYFTRGQYHDAAVMGDFVARRFPQSAGGKQCAKISLACYLKLLESAGGNSNAFEIENVAKATRLIADQWQDTPEAIESLSTVVPIMVNANALELASEFAQSLPEASRQRAMAELVTGQALWAAQLRDQQLNANPGITLGGTTPQAKGKDDYPDALALLLSGYEHLPKDTGVDASVATAVLSLAQALMARDRSDAASTENAEGNASKVVGILEDETFGPLTLIDRDDEAAQNPLFVQESLRTALQAYVSSLGSDPVGMMAKAQEMMARLREVVGADDVGKQRMLAIYVTLAQTMESNIAKAPPQSRKQMSGVFESFLAALSVDASDPGTLNWVAETFASLGAGFDGGGSVLDANAAVYYQKSIDAFNNLLGQINLQPALQMQVRARMAEVKAKIRDYQGAMDDLQQLLKRNPAAVNLQVEAAKVLQRWGSVDSAKYSEAIRGVRSSEKGGAWGWGKIANATMPHAQFRDIFYEARYEIAACQFALAMTLSGSERTKQLAAAEKTLAVTEKLYPKLGGEMWSSKYKELHEKIKRVGGPSK